MTSKIADYALIGDCHGAALVARDGSIDWCTLGRFDADPLFCRILDDSRGGTLKIAPRVPFETSRAYDSGTNILRTTFTTSGGRFRITDLMPVGRAAASSLHDYVDLVASHALIRIVEAIDGDHELEIEFRPSVDFARSAPRLDIVDGGVHTNAGADLRADFPFTAAGDRAHATITLRHGQRRTIVIGRDAGRTFDAVDDLVRITRAFWKEWSQYCRYDGPYREQVLRSALALKLLTYAPTGAIVAAPTTSLPEEVGGVRNWDYRYCWLRDASFTLYALAALGYSGEGRRFMDYVQLACRSTYPAVQIMYGIAGEPRLDERQLDHLDGYNGSRPVRVGNAAFEQDQLDVYGEMIDWAHLQTSLGQRFSRNSRGFFRTLAAEVASRWEKPDQGIWETRSAARNHVFGKIVAWAALDRAVKMFGGRRFRTERAKVLDAIRTQGADSRSGALKDSFETDGADAALLLAPMLGFPLQDSQLAATVARVQKRLTSGKFLRRYEGEDGLPGKEGAFLSCSFWLADALLFLDRPEEARQIFDTAAGAANDVGLLSEEVDPANGELLGNFPQALTHLSLIITATNLQLHEQHGSEALRGSHADRARYTVRATAGIRALWAAFSASHHVGRLRSSRHSMML
ncbi:MAG: glycoside hydrolase family 15 protein [Thermoanaerobaculia bacterium]